MRSTIFLSIAFAGLVAASPTPAPQELDLAQLAALPDVASGPAASALNEDVAVSSLIEVSAIATPSVSSSLLRRGLKTTPVKPRLGPTTISKYALTTVKPRVGPTTVRKQAATTKVAQKSQIVQNYSMPQTTKVTTSILVKPTWRPHQYAKKVSTSTKKTSSKTGTGSKKAAKKTTMTTTTISTESWASPIMRHTTTTKSVASPINRHTTLSPVSPVILATSTGKAQASAKASPALKGYSS
ncbi:hypothetical protein B9Z65_2126 [Elsinoe australis]|uniref:Uncharacterized protein n=1 Tax=Elsinoe australis TaxID=40998 RepID=A0A2P7YN40_9PEZI|nr:hypothetical protein B9Z65_2126 [Elsinoe australis]